MMALAHGVPQAHHGGLYGKRVKQENMKGNISENKKLT
jgi:hypothetical protein